MSITQMSFFAAIMILVVIAIRALAINKLPKKTFLVLWGIVLVRLLIPFSVPSPLSVYSIINRGQNVVVPTETASAKGLPISAMTIAAKNVAEQPNSTVPFSTFISIWIIGVSVCVLFFTVSYFRCRKEFQTSLPVENSYTESWLSEHKITRTIQIRQSGIILAPLTYGFIHPIILMPKNTDWKNREQLKYVLAHEYVHIYRFDAVSKILLACALCIHWFNPLVWAMYILANRDIELSCDETVVHTFGEALKSDYALTLIDMEEKKSRFTPLCNNFSKNAIEERIKSIMKYKKTSVITILIAVGLIISVITIFATSASNVSRQNTVSNVTDTEFSNEEYNKLLALQLDGYEDMTIAEYRQKIWDITDTAEYNDLLERMTQDTEFQSMRYTNDKASFLFNTLEPIRAEQWQQRDFSNYVQSMDIAGQDSAVLEYTITRTITNADKVTVREHNNAIKSIMADLQSFLESKSNAELQNKAQMCSEIDAEIKRIKKEWQTTALSIDISYTFMPSSLNSSEDVDNSDMKASAERGMPGTISDYQSLLSLETESYQNQSVSSFNLAVMEWADNNFDAWERICFDVGTSDIQVELSAKERDFVLSAVILSRAENKEYVQSIQTSAEEQNPVLGPYYLNKETSDNGLSGEVNVSYWITYDISDKSTLTVGERNQCIMSILDEVQSFWNQHSADDLLSMDRDSILKEFNQIATEYSNHKIKATIEEISYEN